MLACLRPVYTGDFSGHPVPHVSFSAFYFFSFSPTFCWLVAFVRIPVSRGRYALPLPPVFTHYKHSTGAQIPVPNIYFSLLLRSKDLDSPCTYYYVTPSQDHSTGCPTHMTFYPPHPPVFTYNRHSTGIWIPVQNINIWISNRRGIAASLHPRKRAWNRR